MNRKIAIVALLVSAPLFGQQTLPPGTQSPDAPAAQASPQHDAAKAPTIAPELAAIEDKIGARQEDAARPMLLHYLQQHGSDARALYDLGYLDTVASQDAPAEADYRKAIVADPQQFESRLALGLILARRGDMAPAHEQLLAATEREPAASAEQSKVLKAQAYRALAQLDVSLAHDGQNDPADAAEAKQSLLAALRSSPETEGDLLLTARIAAASGDPETEEASYRRLIARQPDSVEGLAGLAHVLVQQKKYDEAEPLVRTALSRLPEDPGLNMQLASLLAAQGKAAESIGILEKLHTTEPANSAVDQMLADAYQAAHQSEKAEPLLASLLKSRPEDADLLDEEGKALMAQKRYSEAAALFSRATQLHPADLDAWNGLAFSNSELHDDKVVLAALASRSKLAQDTATTLFLYATSYDRLHQVRPAAEYYQKFLGAAAGKFPDPEWQARHRLVALGQAH